MQVTDQTSIQISDRNQVLKTEDIKKIVQDSLFEPFSVRINHSKWQVRRKLYDQIFQVLSYEYPLTDIDPSLKQPQSFCIWIKNLLDEPHPSSLNEAIKIIELYTSKYNHMLGLKDINCFIGFLIQKSSSTSINMGKFQTIIQNCIREQQLGLGLIIELLKYVESKNNKIAVLSLKGIKLIVTTHEVSEKKHIDLLFDVIVRILESSVKEMRDISLQIMSHLVKFSKQSFETLANTKFKKIRPIVLKQLKSIIDSMQSLSMQDLTIQQQGESYQQQQAVDLRIITPSKLYYLSNITKFDEKRSVIEQFEANLEKSVGSPIVKKDYFQIYNAIDSLLEQSNQIVASSGLRILKIILKIYGPFLPDSNFKRFFHLTVDKYKGIKSQSLNQQIHSVTTSFFLSRQMQMESFVDLCFEVIEKNKSQNARTGVVDWLINEYSKVSVSMNQGKIKIINGCIMKRIELVRKSKCYATLKNEIESLALSLNNLEPINNRSNVHKLTKTQQIPNSLPKQKSTENILSFTQAMQMTSVQKQNLKKKKTQHQPDQPSIEPSISHSITHQPQSSFTSNYQSPIRQLSLLQHLQHSLNNVKKSAFANNRNSMKVYFNDFNSLLTKSQGHQFFEILNIIMTFLDQMIFSDLKKPKVSIHKQMEYIYEEISKSVIQLNKYSTNIDEETLKLELQLILTKIEVRDMRIVETLLDSLYISSTLDKMLKTTLGIYKSYEYYYEPIKEFYSNWLSKKIELVNDTSKFYGIGELFERLDGKVFRAIFKGRYQDKKEQKQEQCIQQQESINQKSIGSSSQRLSFMTPKRDILRSPSIDNQRSRTVSLQTSRQSRNPLISQQTLIVEEILTKNYLKGLQMFNSLLDKRALESSTRMSSPKSNKVEKTDSSFSQFTKIIKLICKRVTPIVWNETINVLIKYKLQYPHAQGELLSIFLVFCCIKAEFCEHKQRLLLLNFLQLLISQLQTLSILSKYKSSFLHIYSHLPPPSTLTFITTTFPFLISIVLNNEPSLNQSQYLINPLCYCLTNPTTYDLADNYLLKIHRGKKSTRGKIEQLLKHKIKDQKLRQAYEEWINKWTIEEMEIGTISQVPELMDEVSNCKSLVDGLGLEQLGGSRSYHSIKFASPIVGLSKIREYDSMKKSGEYGMREVSKSDRPTTSILKNFNSSKQILEQSMQHHTEIHHFDDNEEIKQIDTYNYQKQQLKSLIPSLHQSTALQVSDSIKQLQELFLTSQSNPESIIDNLWEMYESLETEEKASRFVRDMKLALMNSNFIMSMNETNYYVLLSFILKLCSNIPYQQHESQSSFYLRQLLNLFLTYKNPNSVLISLIRILNHQLPQDFTQPLQPSQKLMFKLIINCMDKLVTIIPEGEIRSFEVLLEIYKFFKGHPPETLVEGVPSLREIEAIFNGLKGITNECIEGEKERAKEFVRFIKRKNVGSIYLTYVAAVIERSE